MPNTPEVRVAGCGVQYNEALPSNVEDLFLRATPKTSMSSDDPGMLYQDSAPKTSISVDDGNDFLIPTVKYYRFFRFIFSF